MWDKHLPSIVSVLGMIIVALGAWFTNEASVEALMRSDSATKQRIAHVEEDVRAIDIQIAKDSARLERAAQDIAEMRQDIKMIKTMLIEMSKAK